MEQHATVATNHDKMNEMVLRQHSRSHPQQTAKANSHNQQPKQWATTNNPSQQLQPTIQAKSHNQTRKQTERDAQKLKAIFFLVVHQNNVSRTQRCCSFLCKLHHTSFCFCFLLLFLLLFFPPIFLYPLSFLLSFPHIWIRELMRLCGFGSMKKKLVQCLKNSLGSKLDNSRSGSDTVTIGSVSAGATLW